MQAFLRLKAWQLFLLLFGVPVGLQMVVMGALFTRQPEPLGIAGLVLVTFLGLGLMLAWFYTLGTSLHSRLPTTAPMSLTRFRLAVLLPAVYVSLLLAFGVLASRGGPPDSVPVGLIVLFVALHLLSMACLFYCLYFTAKAFKTVERQAPVPVSEYLGELFLLWFFPIGIWVLQPRINRLFSAPLPVASN